MTLERGSLLNKRYRIVEILGQGGMAAVYRAIDENLGVEVAVKENLFTTEEYARQFRREAVILANLRHPNLPRVTDHFVIEQQGQYLVMDYIEGEDLRQRMERLGQLPEQEVVILGAALCDALTYLHTRSPQVLHRDIKPGNVKITPTGQIFLVDFGLAKMVVGRQATTTGARAMTPGYSPPEQYGTARTDHRSDIYSLGATLYSALTNTIPEDGLARAMEQADLTPLTKRVPKLSKRLANGIEKALEIRPDDRYQSAEEMKNDLLNSRSTTRRRLPLELAIEPPPGGETPLNEFAVEIIGDDGQQKTSNGSDGAPLQVSEPVSDEPPQVRKPARGKKRQGNIGRAIFIWLLVTMLASLAAWIYFDPGMPQQLIDSLGLGSLIQIPGLDALQTPTELPEPEATQTVLAILAQATETPVPTATRTATATWTPTKTTTPTPTIIPTETETPTPSPTPTVVGGGVGQIAFSSDRTGIPEIWLVNVDGTGLVQLTDIAEGACQPSWSPDGLRLVFVSPCKINRTTYAGSSLFIINVDGSGLTQLPSAPGGDFDPNWSFDGKKIVFTSLRFGNLPQVFVLNLEDNSTIRLEEDKANSNPYWSPDSQKIAYIGSDNQIRAMMADGSGRILLARNAFDFKNLEPVWSPDGLTVIFTQVSADLSLSWLMAVQYSPDGGIPVKIQNSDYLSEASFSPDGFWIAATGYPEGNRDVYIMTPSGAIRTALTKDEFVDFDPAWRPNVVNPNLTPTP